MKLSTRWILACGALLLMLAVMLGAFGAHALKQHLSEEMLTVYKTAVDYQFIHALGLLAIGILLLKFPESRLLVYAASSLALGIVLFCGSLYALSLTDIRLLGAVTPFGGLAFITGWLLLVIGVFRI